MPTKKYKPKQVVNLLQQIEVETTNGKTKPQAAGRVTSVLAAIRELIGSVNTTASASAMPLLRVGRFTTKWIVSEQITAFCAVGDDRKQKTYARLFPGEWATIRQLALAVDRVSFSLLSKSAFLRPTGWR